MRPEMSKSKATIGAPLTSYRRAVLAGLCVFLQLPCCSLVPAGPSTAADRHSVTSGRIAGRCSEASLAAC